MEGAFSLYSSVCGLASGPNLRFSLDSWAMSFGQELLSCLAVLEKVKQSSRSQNREGLVSFLAVVDKVKQRIECLLNDRLQGIEASGGPAAQETKEFIVPDLDPERPA